MTATTPAVRFCSACGAAGAAAFCPACGVASGAPPAVPAPVFQIAAPSVPSLTWTIVKALTIGGAIVLLFVFIGSAGNSSSSPATPMPGTLATLAAECPAASSKADYHRFSDSLRQNDRAGAVAAILAGGGIFLAKGTSVMAKDWSFPDIEEVSVQTPGDHFGEQLFLSWSCVRGAQ